MGKKAKVGSGYKEKELEAVQTIENLWRPLQQAGKESEKRAKVSD